MNENENANACEKYTAVVKSVLTSNEFGVRRMSFILDKAVKQIKDGKEIETNVVSFNSGQLTQCKSNIELLALVDALACGRPVNRQILALLVKGAKVTFSRVFVPKGAITISGEVAQTSTYSTRLEYVENNVPAIMTQFALNLINSKLFEEETSQSNQPSIESVLTIPTN